MDFKRAEARALKDPSIRGLPQPGEPVKLRKGRVVEVEKNKKEEQRCHRNLKKKGFQGKLVD